ncbi:MAG: hypothetical protein AAF292_00460 [Pseudomonadota bacterium]
MHLHVHEFFVTLVILHIIGGVPGLISFWVPVLTKKGGKSHVFWGKVFTISMLFTGTVAVGMSTTTLIAPLPTHPGLAEHPELYDASFIRGIFGWMMLYLAILTINLAWHGWRVLKNRRDHKTNRGAFSLFLQFALLISSLNCAIQGLLIGQVMMVGISFVGIAAFATNMVFIMQDTPARYEWQLEHIKAIVGAGISVYTAFLAFGAVRLMPSLALAPVLWAFPLVTGLAIIIYHRRAVRTRFTGSKSPPQSMLNTLRKFWLSGEAKKTP